MQRISQVHFAENVVAVVHLFSIGCKVSVTKEQLTQKEMLQNSNKREENISDISAFWFFGGLFLVVLVWFFWVFWVFFFPQVKPKTQQLKYQNLGLFILRMCRSTTSLEGEGKAACCIALTSSCYLMKKKINYFFMEAQSVGDFSREGNIM